MRMSNGWTLVCMRMCMMRVMLVPLDVCERMTASRQSLVLLPVELVFLRLAHGYVFRVSMPGSRRISSMSLHL